MDVRFKNISKKKHFKIQKHENRKYKNMKIENQNFMKMIIGV